MVLQRSTDRTPYIHEMNDITYCLAKLIKDPKCKVRFLSEVINVFMVLDAIMILCSFYMISDIIKQPSPSGIVFAIVIYLFIFFIALLVVTYKIRLKNHMSRKDEDYSSEIDEKGLSYITPKQKTTVYWSSIQSIRAFKYSMVFIAKDRKSMSFIAPIENLESVEKFLKDNGIELEIIR